MRFVEEEIPPPFTYSVCYGDAFQSRELGGKGNDSQSALAATLLFICVYWTGYRWCRSLDTLSTTMYTCASYRHRPPMLRGGRERKERKKESLGGIWRGPFTPLLYVDSIDPMSHCRPTRSNKFSRCACFAPFYLSSSKQAISPCLFAIC